jgi:GR25 family glycosyltransferase involved in LPS biosynthesis
MPTDFPHDLYIVAAPQIFDRLPPQYKRIVFQLEQSGVSHWFTPAYFRQLNSSLAIFDYSLENIDYLLKNGSAFKTIFHLPIRPTDLGRTRKTRDIDVLFYGALGKSRRHEILRAPGKHHNIRIESNLFGAELTDLLDRAKVVVNIHFYEGALLETTRIAQALSHGARVVSEVAEDQHRNAYYEGLVDFVPVGDVPAMAEAITRVLANWTEPDIQTLPDREAFDGTRFMLLRALMACGVITFQELWRACGSMTLPSDRIVLGLPESLTRHDFALRNRLDGAVIFPGLRLTAGWMGCALSYKFLAMLAVQQNKPRLTIYEDDADFGTEGHQRLARLESYLAGHQADWDIFSGLLSDLDEEAQVTAVYEVGDEQLVEVDRVIGMVFGIYDLKALEMIADFHFAGNDTNKHTIDRYLESFRMKVLSLVRPLVDHHDDLSSTIWNVENSKITESIAASRRLLEQKVEAFQKAAMG